MSIGRFSCQLEYGYSPLQIYFKKDLNFEEDHGLPLFNF